MRIYEAKPTDVDLAIPAQPQRLDQIMGNFFGDWEAAFSGGYFDITGKLTATKPLATNAWGTLVRNGLQIQGPSGENRPSFVVTDGNAYILDVVPHYATVAVEGGPWLIKSGNTTDIPREVARSNTHSIQPTVRRARNGIGINREGNVVYLHHPQATLAEFQNVLVNRGVHDGMNLDGGGSATIMTRKEGLIVPGGRRPLPAGIVFRKLIGLNVPTPKPTTGALWSGVVSDILPTLSLGVRGNQVKLLQTLLRLVGIDPGPIDGIFGTRTRDAVIAYQRRFKLSVDGVVGNQTWGQFEKPIRLQDTAGAGAKITPNFSLREFACKHCQNLILMYLPDLCVVLEQVRSRIGNHPITITSGYRCPTHNRAVGGAPASQHLFGKAADIRSGVVSRSTIYTHASDVLGNRGAVLTYPKKNFNHLDLRRNRVRQVME